MPVIEEIGLSIENGRALDTERLVMEALEAGISEQEIMRCGLVPAMRNVGNEFKKETVDIPRVLSAARCVQKALDILEPNLQRDQKEYLGTAILGTVEGDLHEVGKNIVAIMFRSVGFHVIDLGVDVSERQFLQAVREHPEAALVCISSLLTTSSPQLRKVVQTLKKNDKKKKLKIMVGGGSVTAEFAREIGADGYTENAVDAAELARSFCMEKTGEEQ